MYLLCVLALNMVLYSGKFLMMQNFSIKLKGLIVNSNYSKNSNYTVLSILIDNIKLMGYDGCHYHRISKVSRFLLICTIITSNHN